MANIDAYIEQIRVAEYGEEVRGSIINALVAENVESNTAYTAAITAQDSARNSAASAASSASTATGALGDVINAGNTAVSNIKAEATTALTAMDGYEKTTASNAAAAAKSATDAANSASTAQTYLSTVQASAAAAKTSETNAKASETNAKTSETNAKTSETNAKKSADDASAARTQAQQASSNAQTSASAANASQTAAAVSASNAATSEQAAFNYAQQAKAVVNIDVATATKPGIVTPDGMTISVNQFGALSVIGLTEHTAQSLVSQDGVHGVRINIDQITKLITLQQWNTETLDWDNLFTSLKPDGETIVMDEDGTIHGANNLPLTVKEGKLCIKYLKDV